MMVVDYKMMLMREPSLMGKVEFYSLSQASLASLLLLWEQGHSEAGGHHYTGGTWPKSAEESKEATIKEAWVMHQLGR